jgi:hypothetical protein
MRHAVDELEEFERQHHAAYSVAHIEEEFDNLGPRQARQLMRRLQKKIRNKQRQ